ncbi:MAG: (2Fe-2S)-binding protein [Proteobacteria bacterium]|nr:(2Fe-2S)-binding protein [Pseudomonadota bacterium]
MIVCVCNRLNDAKIRAARDLGARCVDDVFACHGVRRNCGSCLETMQALLGSAPEDRENLVAAQ